MVEVIYCWQMEPQDFEAFQETWRSTTNHIHKTVPGALRSFTLKGFEDECECPDINGAPWHTLAKIVSSVWCLAGRNHRATKQIRRYR